MKILAICGSLQGGSSNLALLERAAELAPPGTVVEFFDGVRALPPFDTDLEAHGSPPSVAAFRDALVRNDAVLIASPEYGHSLPGALKNAIDWVIGTGELERKIVAITASTPSPERGRRGLAALRDTLGAVRATVIGGEPIARGPDVDRELNSLLAALAAAITARAADPARDE